MKEATKDDITQLNSFLRGELSAVETYDQAIAKLGDDPAVRGKLDNCRTSHQLRATLLREEILPVGSMDEVFICGPEAMITATEAALKTAGVPEGRVYAERFTTSADMAAKVQADSDAKAGGTPLGKLVALRVLLDGKFHEVPMGSADNVLDAALNAGLDLPYSCKGGVCSTCRCKVMEGAVSMDKNFALDAGETAQGYVLSCQAKATTPALVVSFDER